MRLVLVGPPGAGKGTQAKLLSQELGVPHISTGDLFRAHVGDGSDIGQKVQEYLDAGALVPDELTNEMVRERLADADADAGFVLDGFPRNAEQARVLGDILAQRGHRLDAVMQFDVPEDVVVERLLARGRSDDTEDVIRQRQRVYRDETAPLLDYYADMLIHIDATGEVEEINARALKLLSDVG